MHGFEQWDGTKRCFSVLNRSASAGALKDFVVIETGGENHEDQHDRLRFLMRELQRFSVAGGVSPARFINAASVEAGVSPAGFKNAADTAATTGARVLRSVAPCPVAPLKPLPSDFILPPSQIFLIC
jgi:hypothetical protein